MLEFTNIVTSLGQSGKKFKLIDGIVMFAVLKHGVDVVDKGQNLMSKVKETQHQ